MSHDTSSDDEVKDFLSLTDSDESKEDKIPKEKPKEKEEKNDGIHWETNTEDSPDDEW